jgi:hypothetical protein
MQQHSAAVTVIIFVLVTRAANEMPVICDGFIVINQFITIFTASAFMSSTIVADNLITNPGVILSFGDDFTAAVAVSYVFFVHNLSSS